MNHEPIQTLLLLGAGHANVAVIRALVMHPDPRIRLIVVHPRGEAAYSGMLPAALAGDRSLDDLQINVQALTERAGGWFIRGEVTGLDAAGQTVSLKRPHWLGGEPLPPIAFDHAIINTGAEPGRPFPSTHRALFPVKPLHQFIADLAVIDRLAREPTTQSLAIVGSGPAGLELAFAARRRYGPTLRIQLIGRTPFHADPVLAAANRLITGALTRHRIDWMADNPVVSASETTLHCADGSTIEADLVWVATPVQPASWLDQTALQRCSQGFLQVNAHLQCLGHPRVYAAGDVATLAQSRPRSGVMAVRAGQYLAKHLPAILSDRRVAPFRPQRRWLTLLNTADQQAILVHGALALQGSWILRWKYWIDDQFMDRFQMRPMQGDAMHCEGCAAKIPGDTLRSILPEGQFQDAEAIQWGEATVLQSIDGLTHSVSDPELMGRLAVRHAASDVIVSGGTGGVVLNCIGVKRSPNQQLMAQEFAWVLHGIRQESRHLGLTMAGGHVLSLAQSMITVAVSARTQHRIEKGTIPFGTAVWITGPVGTGLLFAGVRQGLISGRAMDQVLARWHQYPPLSLAVQLASSLGAVSLTDVSGFGVAGHLSEMLGEHATHFVWHHQPQLIPEVETAYAAGLRSSASIDNRQYSHPSLCTSAEALCFDPQTGGPLLIAIAEAAGPTLGDQLRAAGFEPQYLGTLVDPMS